MNNSVFSKYWLDQKRGDSHIGGNTSIDNQEDIIMQLGIFSDVHDHLQNLQKALEAFKQHRLTTLIFCGDFCSPIPARAMASFAGEIHCVFGNGDGDRFQIGKIAQHEHPNLKLHGEYACLELDGFKFAVTHYPFYAQALASTGEYRAVFSGHTHVQSEERVGECLWLNPGEVMGWKAQPTCAVYDSRAHQVEIIALV